MSTKVCQAVVLAGGLGTRLRPFTLTTPKPMLRFHGKPFLEYLIDNLRENGITKIFILVGYLHEQIESYFRDGKMFGVNISYSYSTTESNTGTRLRNAKDKIEPHFLLVYGDNYWPLALSELVTFYDKSQTRASVTVYRNLDKYSKNNMFVDKNGLVRVYDKTRRDKKVNGVDIGYFILEKSLLDLLSNSNISFEETLLPLLIKRKQLSGFLTYHKYYSLSNIDRIDLINTYFQNTKTVLLDRDGVINVRADKGQYITSWKHFIFKEGVFEALQRLIKSGYKLYILTNQAGIARGYMTENDLTVIHKQMLDVLSEKGIHIEQIYTCLHGWDEGCFCRKPNPGLLYQASWDHAFNLRRSYFIGDDERDVMASQFAGCKSVYINTSESTYSGRVRPDIIAISLIDAVNKILRNHT